MILQMTLLLNISTEMYNFAYYAYGIIVTVSTHRIQQNRKSLHSNFFDKIRN